ncbi:hypothetical protein KGQ64_01830 [bacterium]|nr:hypothetical protein [bacterium]
MTPRFAPNRRTRASLARFAAALIVALLLVPFAGSPARACDVCAAYTPCDECDVYRAVDETRSKVGLRIGLFEQYTQFRTEQLNGREQPNPFGEHLYSSISQVLVGWQFTRRFSVQANLPVIVRNWRRVLGAGEIQTSTRGGIGDLVLLGNFLAWDRSGDDGLLRFDVLGGLELPTGDSGFLAEEMAEEEGMADGHGLARPAHGDEVPSGVHGHDLAFGSGSVDGVIGLQVFGSWHRFFGSAVTQYKITRTGSYGYRYANDLTWWGGPGAWLVLDPKYTFSAQAILSGETKGQDVQKGVSYDDTGMTSLFCGPAFAFTWGTSVNAEVAAVLPVVLNNTGYQIVPDFRLRAALVWRF